MKTLQSISIIAALMLMTLCAQAASVTVVEAQMTAQNFLRSQSNGRLMASAGTLQLAHSQASNTVPGAADYYVFNSSDGGAFVIVAGDDRVQEILGYGDHAVDMNDLPCNLGWLLNQYSEQMEYLYQHPNAQVKSKKAASSSMIVEPLLVSNWYQGEPFNDQCPSYKGHKCPVGCVATAMAQVMYYWKYPADLPELDAYVTNAYGIYMDALPPVLIDWENLLEDYNSYYTPAQALAASTLLRYCGQACQMDYNPSGSGSTSYSQLNAMVYFGFNMSARVYKRQDYDDAEWDEMMREELEAARPILYTGTGDEGGHAFVVDGFIGSYYHINWGWGGNWDGYFELNDFVVSDMEFTSNQDMLRSIYPSSYSESILPYDFEQDGICYKIQGDELCVTNREYNYNSYSGEVTIPAQVTYEGVTRAVTRIGNNAFNNCQNLTRVVIPQGVKSIGNFAFKHCSSLKSISIPSSVTSIGYRVFSGCKGLTSVTLSNQLTEIPILAFVGCSGLTNVVIPASVKSIGDAAFYNCTQLQRINTGNGAQFIGNQAFYKCNRLKDVVVGDNVKVVSERSFEGCVSLERLTLGEHLDSVGPNAFNGCRSLNSITVKAEDPPLLVDVNCFPDAVYHQATLFVPKIAQMDYYLCDVWTLFENQTVISDEHLPGDVNGDGEVTVADMNVLVEGILNEGSRNESMDVNGDGEVSVADINVLVNLILQGAA